MFFGGYDPWGLLIQWSRGKLSLVKAFRQALKIIVMLDNHRKLNDRDIIFHQREIEFMHQVLADHKARIEKLEWNQSLGGNKGNGVMT